VNGKGFLSLTHSFALTGAGASVSPKTGGRRERRTVPRDVLKPLTFRPSRKATADKAILSPWPRGEEKQTAWN